MRISNQIQIKDKWSDRPVRSGEAFLVSVMNMVQDFYNEDGHKFKYLPSDETEIWVGTMDSFVMNDPGQKPAIVFQEGDIEFANVSGMGKRYSQNRIVGSTTYTDLVSYSVTMNCIHNKRHLSRDIGLDMFELFGYTRQGLLDRGIKNFKGPRLLQTAKLTGSIRPDSWSTPLTMSGQMQITWEVTPEAPTVKEINIRSNPR